MSDLAVWTMNDLEKAAQYIVKSRLFGVQDATQAVTLMLLAQAEGIHPMRAIQEYHIIQGRPSLKADAMLARFQQAGGSLKWLELSDEVCAAEFSHPQGGTATIRWTIEDAKRAGLLGKTGSGWSKYPRAMLRSRVVSEGVRTVYPGVIVGSYTPEEVSHFDSEPVTVTTKSDMDGLEAEYNDEMMKTVSVGGVEIEPIEKHGHDLHKILGAMGIEDHYEIASEALEKRVESLNDLTDEERKEVVRYAEMLEPSKGLSQEDEFKFTTYLKQNGVGDALKFVRNYMGLDVDNLREMTKEDARKAMKEAKEIHLKEKAKEAA